MLVFRFYVSLKEISLRCLKFIDISDQYILYKTDRYERTHEQFY